VRDDELGFDGLPIEAFPLPRNDEASAAVSPPRDAGDIAESFLAEVLRAHRAVLDVHQSISDRLLASAESAVAGHLVLPARPEVPSPRAEPDASRGPTAPRPVRQLLRPQLPVGDMRMFGTVLEFDGTPGEFPIGSTLLSNFPVPHDAWFHSEDRSSLANLAWQEIALQAAGKLCDLNEIALSHIDEDLVLRNLEGRSRLLRHGSPLGRTVQVRTELLGHTSLPKSALLRFGFAVALDGEPCYEGETVHGVFTPDVLGRETGLDGGRRVPTWLERQSSPPPVIKAVPSASGEVRLDLIDDADIVLGGGDHGAGYVLARKRIDPTAWYFDLHFPGDPVMPGSLGVETLFHAIRAYGIAAGLTETMSAPCFAPAFDAELTWKYRGQVLRENDQIQCEVHLRAVQREPGRVLLHADGSLYCDGLRVYQVDGICIELREGLHR
jgi:3-hydroxymyristoyl/3-hydroxydecanoyl-(acyl carrier protein) dehydratase